MTKREINCTHSMRHPFGYARLNAGLIMSGIMLLSVLLYQYISFRQPQAVVERDGEIVPSYSFVQLFPQTLPATAASAYELAVVDSTGTRFSLGRFVLLDQDRIADTSGRVIANALFRLPGAVTSLRGAEIRVVELERGRQPFSLEYVSGAFNGDRAIVTYFEADEAVPSGSFMLGTPTDGDQTINERSGLWFGNYQTGLADLRLPALRPGWVYEGWAIIDGQPLTTGRFRQASSRDLFSGFSARAVTAPAMPGEDFLLDPPVLVFPNLSFPVDLAGDVVQVSIEPDVNGVDPTGQGPFGFTILSSDVPRRADPAIPYDLESSADALPKATVVLRQ